ncbi:MAG: dihydropteroate synthase [Puniceicoccales bacterium]|jgi:dihydropteroate synthase|nr:dihydropteroate synthase [Puniceicoccales bacterium]
MKKPFHIWGILNLTPDSFSDGNPRAGVADFVAKGLQLAAEGADFIDIGGESSRPGAVPISEAEEMARVMPVLDALLAGVAIPLSIDTRRASVARAALAKGVAIVNDIFGLQGDGAMADVVASRGARVVVMHGLGQTFCADDIVADVAAFWQKSLAIARRAGILEKKVLLDPGIGFGKTVEQNVLVLRHLDSLCAAFPGQEIFLGISRKSILGYIGDEPKPQRRDLAGIVVIQEALRQGVRHFRVHAVAMARRALSIWKKIYGQ